MNWDSNTEREVCGALKALVEEWGPDMVKVHLPAKWKSPEHNLGRVTLLFDTTNTIDLEVRYADPRRPEYTHTINRSYALTI